MVCWRINQADRAAAGSYAKQKTVRLLVKKLPALAKRIGGMSGHQRQNLGEIWPVSPKKLVHAGQHVRSPPTASQADICS